MVPQNFGQKFLDALIHVVNGILKVILIPFETWTKALVCLAEQKKPIYDPTVGLNLNLLYDGLKFLSYPLGVIKLVYDIIADKWYKLPFGDMFELVIYTLIAIYLIPVFVIALSFFVKIAWAVAVKIYNFIVKPHYWKVAIKHVNEEEK